MRTAVRDDMIEQQTAANKLASRKDFLANASTPITLAERSIIYGTLTGTVILHTAIQLNCRSNHFALQSSAICVFIYLVS